MTTTSQDDRQSLRTAIVRALHLADSQNESLVAAILAEALDAADREIPE